MATTSLYKGSQDGITSCEFTIASLSADWNDSNYIQVGVATNSVTSGQSAAPSGIKGSVSAPSSGTARSVDGIASGLNPGETNTLYGFAQAANGLYYPAGSDSILMNLTQPTDLTLTSYTYASLQFNWNNVTGATGYDVGISPKDASDQSVGSSNCIFVGLTPGTSYVFAVQATGESTSRSIYAFLEDNITPPDAPSVSYSSKTETSITVNVTKGNGNADAPKVYWKKTTASSYNSYTFSSFGNCTISGLDSDTAYDIRAVSVITLNGTLYTSSFSNEITVTTEGGRPSNFSWNYSTITSGTAAIVDYRDWNALNAKINEFRTYKSLSTYSYTTVASGDDFLASYFNLARSKIDDMNNTGLTTKSTGDDLNASDLNTLVSTLNAVS